MAYLYLFLFKIPNRSCILAMPHFAQFAQFFSSALQGQIQWEQHHLLAWHMYYSVSSAFERQWPWLSTPDWWSWPNSRSATVLTSGQCSNLDQFLSDLGMEENREGCVFWWVPWNTEDTYSCIKDVQKCILHDRSPLTSHQGPRKRKCLKYYYGPHNKYITEHSHKCP